MSKGAKEIEETRALMGSLVGIRPKDQLKGKKKVVQKKKKATPK